MFEVHGWSQEAITQPIENLTNKLFPYSAANMQRRISVADKGKQICTEDYQAPRTARVRAELPENTELINKCSLTLIGRVTNRSVQKIWPLLSFFSDLWKSDVKPVGADLGNGLFQFQFEREEDLLQVLEKRPYHFARWMVIVQRWEPTLSKAFPSLIPFWIKIQGIPIHLWSEGIATSIGNDIGIFEKAEITPLAMRMRAHVNGLLPLITSTVIEYPNGEEVTASLVYERLERHCTTCLRLDHDVNDCLEEKAKKRLLRASQEADRSKQASQSSVREGRDAREQSPRDNTIYQFSASKRANYRERRSHNDQELQDHRQYKLQPKTWKEKEEYRRASQVGNALATRRSATMHEGAPLFYKKDKSHLKVEAITEQ